METTPRPGNFVHLAHCGICQAPALEIYYPGDTVPRLVCTGCSLPVAGCSCETRQ